MNTSGKAMLAADGAGISIFMRQRRRSISFERLIDWARDIAGVAPSPRYWFDANAASVGTSFHVAAARVGGFRVIMHPTASRTVFDDNGHPFRVTKQVGVDVDLALTISRSHSRDDWNTLILLAGDGDFYPLVQRLVEEHSVRVILVAAKHSASAYITPYVNQYHSLESLVERICA
jgi:uncharacterized LabA/DUF88 family protein